MIIQSIPFRQVAADLAELQDLARQPHPMMLYGSLTTDDTPAEEPVRIDGGNMCSVEKARFYGPYDPAITMHFCLYGELKHCNFKLAKSGARVGSGQLGGIPGATATNSASNLFRVEQCRFHGAPDATTAFEIDGSKQVTFEQSTIEGHHTEIGIDWKSRHARSMLRLQDFWHEATTTNILIKAWGSDYQRIVIDNLIMSDPAAINQLINAGNAHDLEVHFTNNSWSSIPTIRCRQESTRFTVDPSCNFTDDDVMQACSFI